MTLSFYYSGNTKANGVVKGKQKDVLQETDNTMVKSKGDETMDHIQGDGTYTTVIEGDLSEGDMGKSRRVSNRPKTCAKKENEEKKTELEKISVATTRTRSKRSKSKNEVDKVDTDRNVKSEIEAKSESNINCNELERRRGSRKKEEIDVSVSEAIAKGKDSMIDKTSEPELKRPTRGKLKESEEYKNEEALNKRKSRSKGNSSDDVQRKDTDGSCEITENKSKSKQNKSEPLGKIIDETNKQPTRSKRTGQRTTRELKTETKEEKVNDLVTIKSAIVEQGVDTVASQEEVKPSRSRRTKVNANDDDKVEDSVVNSGTDISKISVKSEPVKRRKRKVTGLENDSNVDQLSSSNSLNDKSNSSVIESERPIRATTKQKLEELQTDDNKTKGKTIEKKDNKAVSKENKTRRPGKRKGTDESSTDSNDVRFTFFLSAWLFAKKTFSYFCGPSFGIGIII